MQESAIKTRITNLHRLPYHLILREISIKKLNDLFCSHIERKKSLDIKTQKQKGE